MVKQVHLLQVNLHRIRRHQREERIDTVLAEVVGESPQEKSTERASEAKCAWITLAVVEAPGSQIEWRKVVSEESVASGQSDGVAENGTTDCVSWAEASAIDEWFGFFGLEADIELEVVDVTIQQLSCTSDLWVRVPLKEAGESYSKVGQ